MRTTFRASLLVVLGVLLLAGCEDDPILEPTGEDDTGGGSYGNMTLVAPAASDTLSPSRGSNPEIF